MDINKFKALCKMAVLNARKLEDKESLEVIDLYPDYDYLCQISYVAKESGFKFKHNGVLYKTIPPNHQFQSQWTPGEGTSSIYTQFSEIESGTLDDPIHVPEDVHTNAFTYIVGKYYLWEEKIYKCVHGEDEEGTEYSFVYSPQDLINNFFVLIE